MAEDTWSADGFNKQNLTPRSGNVTCFSIDDGLTATGSTHADALQLVSTMNVITTAASGTGVLLPSVVAPGAKVYVINGGANVLTVYPAPGGKVNGTSANTADAATVAAVSSGVPGKLVYIQDGTLTSGVPNYLRIG